MKVSSWRKFLLIAALGAVALGATAALGDRSTSDPGQLARQLIAEVKQAERAKVAREPLAHAERALARAADLRRAEDHTHAEMVEALALEWAETASDLLAAVEAEDDALRLQQEAEEVETKAVRARALVEETLARRNRAQAKLELVEAGEDPDAPEPAPTQAEPQQQPTEKQP